jgi:hypothetical protein
VGPPSEVTGVLADDALSAVAQLWGVPVGTLETSLCMEPVLSSEGLMVGVQPALRNRVYDTIRTTACAVYNMLVESIVTRMNDVLTGYVLPEAWVVQGLFWR